jgi:RHS repeat-associated protein
MSRTIISIFIFISAYVTLFGQDTTIFNQDITLNSDWSSYDNVEVLAGNTVTLEGGFYYSSDGSGEFTANADIYSVDGPDGYSPYYQPGDSTQASPEQDYHLPVGTIPGYTGLSPSGGGTYSIPIELPLAQNGMVPGVGISYNSQSNNGTLGKKWRLDGISSIAVSGRTRYYDGVYAPLNENDTLCSIVWDGQRLLSVGGQGLAADTFKTEAITNISITKEVVQYDTLFKIMTPNGITMLYGNSENSRFHYSDSIKHVWMLEKVFNRTGDTIEYTYNIDTVKRQVTLSKIEYGRGDGGFLNEVSFYYERTSNLQSNQTLNYLSIDDLLLDSIAIQSTNTYYGSYAFRYDTTGNRSLLKEILQYDRDGYRYNSTKVEWDSPVFNIQATPTTKTIVSGDNFEYFTGEYTGDGFDDLIAVQRDSASGAYDYYLYKGSSAGLSSSYDESGNLPRSYTHEFWVDLKSSVYQNCQQNSSSQFKRDDITYILSGDFDGDGIDELMVKIREWDVLFNYLPTRLNDGFETNFANGFNGLESIICNYNYQILYPEIFPMSLNSSLGKIISFNEEETSENRIRAIRLGEDNDQIPVDHYLPDIAGFGYSLIPDNNKINYYDLENDSLKVYCTGAGGKYWGDFNSDGISDYLYQNSGEWRLGKYNFKSNIFSAQDINCKTILGTIDLNSDGTSGWVAIEEDNTYTVTIWDLFYLWCKDDCNYKNDILWNEFLAEFDLSGSYSSYWQSHCNDDDFVCRYNYMNSNDIEITTGGAVYIDHLDAFGPGVLIEDSRIETDGYITTKYTRSLAVDINSDGKEELLLFFGNKLKKILYDFKESFEDGEISITFSTYECDIAMDYLTRIGDFNGDGNIELISPANNNLLSFITSGKPGFFVSTITNGIGLKTDYIYKPISDVNTYAGGIKSNYPIINVHNPWYVIRAIVKDNGVAERDSVTYTYEEAKFHLEGKGFLGYKKIVSEQHLTNRIDVSIFDFDSTYYFMYPDSSWQFVGDTLISSKQYFHSVNTSVGNQYQLLTDSITIWNNLNNFEVTTKSRYNSNGQVVASEKKVDDIALVKQSFEYTNAGWYYPYLIEKNVVEYNRNGSVIADSTYWEYDTQGQITLKKAFWGSENELLTLFQNYNDYGKPLRISMNGKMGPGLSNDSIVRTYTYSDYGRFLTSEAGPVLLKKYFDYDLSTGKLVKEYLPNGLETTYQYGAFNTLEEEMSPDKIQSFSKTYWAIGYPDAPPFALYYSWNKNSTSNEIVTFYDEIGRELRTVSTNFNGEKIFVDTRYDSKGRIWKTSLPYKSTGTPFWTVYSYDNIGRIHQVVSADSIITTNEYAPLCVETTVSRGTYSATQSTVSNALGETIQVEDTDGNKIFYQYYADGKLKAASTSVHPSDTIKLEYDKIGNRTLIDDPDAGTVKSEYDAFSRLIRQITARDDTVEYNYDKLGRTIQRIDQRGITRYVYRTDSISPAFGKIDSIYCSNLSQSVRYNYENSYGRLVTSTMRMPGQSLTNSYTYDWFGRQMSRTYPAGLITEYSYAENGQLKSILGNGIEVWSCEAVNQLGQITSFSQGSYNTEMKFDDYGILNEITTGSIFNMEYIHNDAGNIASREDVLTNQKELFSYDDLNRLTKIEYYLNNSHLSSSDIDITYGGDGNITSKTDVGQTINYGENTAGPHALTSVEGPTSAYKPYPQIITYTDFNKVKSIIDTIALDTTLSLEIKYSLLNKRVKSILKENDVIKTIKYYSNQFEIDSTSDGLKKYNYILSPTGLAAVFVQQGSGNDTMYYTIQDNLGSICAIVNEATDSINYFSYSSWGHPRHAGNWTEDLKGLLFADRGFSGHEHLMDFDLINMNGRIYDPVVSRFLSPDLLIQSANNLNSYNRYSYVLNNPLIFNDPSGYEVEKPLRSDASNYIGGGNGGGSEPFFCWINRPPSNSRLMLDYGPGFEDYFVWMEGPSGGAFVNKSDITYIDFESFMADLRANNETANFTLGLELGYNGSIWVVGSSYGTKSSFAALNKNNYMDYSVATVIGRQAANSGDGISYNQRVSEISLGIEISAGLVETAGKTTALQLGNGVKGVSAVSKIGRGAGTIGFVIAGVHAGYEYKTGNANTHTVIDLGVTALAATAVGVGVIVSSPIIITGAAIGGAAWGIYSLFGGGEAIDNKTNNWGRDQIFYRNR